MNTAFIKLKEFLETIRSYNILLNNAMENEYDDWNYKALEAFLYNMGVKDFDCYDEPKLVVQMKDGMLEIKHINQGLEIIFDGKNGKQSKLLYPLNSKNNKDQQQSSLRDLVFALDEITSKEIIEEIYFLKIDEKQEFENKAIVASFKDRVKLKINYPKNVNHLNVKSSCNFNQKRQLLHRRRV